LFCGVERLEIDIGVAVAVTLDVFVDLILNDGSQHGAILHIPIYLKRLVDKIDHHLGFGKPLSFGNCQNAGFGSKGRPSCDLGGLPRF